MMKVYLKIENRISQKVMFNLSNLNPLGRRERLHHLLLRKMRI
jgi:hypothetical protein